MCDAVARSIRALIYQKNVSRDKSSQLDSNARTRHARAHSSLFHAVREDTLPRAHEAAGGGGRVTTAAMKGALVVKNESLVNISHLWV